MEFPEDRLYSQEGFWVKLDNDIATVGISEYFRDQLGGLISIGYNQESDNEILTIQSASKSYVLCGKPISGNPISGNNEALQDPSRVNDAPYGENSWLYKMATTTSAAANLMTAAQIRASVGQ